MLPLLRDTREPGVTRLIHHTPKCLANIAGPLQVSQGSVIFMLRDGKQAEDLHDAAGSWAREPGFQWILFFLS
jgi:hypothetical protein